MDAEGQDDVVSSAEGFFASGPPTSPWGWRDRRPVSYLQSGPALSNGAARLQDDEMGKGRKADRQFVSNFDLSDQHSRRDED
jgi:hypothetical protein